jgi:hypothetical protein
MALPSHVQLQQQVHLPLDLLLQQRENVAFQTIVQSSKFMLCFYTYWWFAFRKAATTLDYAMSSDSRRLGD